MKNKDAGNKAYISKPKNGTPPKDDSKKVTIHKGKDSKEDNLRRWDQAQNYFSIEDKVAKINISIPLTELLKNFEYHSKIATLLKPREEISEI